MKNEIDRQYGKERVGYSSFTAALRFNLLLDIKRLAWPSHTVTRHNFIFLCWSGLWNIDFRLCYITFLVTLTYCECTVGNPSHFFTRKEREGERVFPILQFSFAQKKIKSKHSSEVVTYLNKLYEKKMMFFI